MKNKTTRLSKPIATTFLILIGFYSAAQTTDMMSKNKIDTVVSKFMLENNIVGLSIGIVKNNKIFYTKGYGTKEINKAEPIDQFTNFLTSSISKLFTATAIMQLVEKGKIDLSKKLIDYVPDFEMKDKRYKDITIEQMLTHTSGLPNIWKRNYIHPLDDSVALSDFAQKLKKEKLSYEPGVQLSAKTYSNTAYNILGFVIERVTHQTFDNYVTNNVIIPSGMDSTHYSYTKINKERISKPHKINTVSGNVETSKYYPDLPQDKPCGNLNSCSYDMCQWMLHNLSIYNGATSTKMVLDNKTLVNMWTTKKEIPPYNTSIGLGWWVVQSDKYGKYVFHDGNDPGFSAALVISPINNFGVVVLCNSEYPKEIVWNKIPFAIMNVFNNEWKK